MKNGVPYDVAFSLGPAEKLAHVVAMGEDSMNVFEWETMTWRARN